ncbi:MAG: hypothetical protein IKN27_01090, partial [Selenomonadaceae bacterium]|nr:hypothetical protein [Selenomonadaceae bacterium]
ACCGTHCDTLWEIGQIKINSVTKVSDGVIRIEFVAGVPAILAHHEDMEIISACQGIFGSRKSMLAMTG